MCAGMHCWAGTPEEWCWVACPPLPACLASLPAPAPVPALSLLCPVRPPSPPLPPPRQVAEYDNCKLLLVDKKISTARDMIGILEGAIRGGHPLLIMAEDIEQASRSSSSSSSSRSTAR